MYLNHFQRELDLVKRTRVGNLTSWTSPWLSRHLGKWRTWEWVIRGPPSLKIPSTHLYEFPTFWCGHFFVKDGRTKVRSILFCPSALRTNTCTKCHLKICFLLTDDVFTRCCPRHKKNHTERHEIIPQFSVRFASIHQISNEMKFWTTVTKHQSAR